MTEHAVQQGRICGAAIEIRYTDGSQEQMHDWLGDDLAYVDQGEGNLGDRMQRAFADAFAAGWRNVVLMGSDCPSNEWQNLRVAFKMLETDSLVIGPASDGGYYLIGLNHPVPRLFEQIEWGGDQVFQQTLRAAENVSVHRLPELHDVDLPEDIPPKISVVVPTRNEEAHLFQTLEKVRAGFNVEIIVVDGGSTDGTRTIFPDMLACEGGRAAQQNFGVIHAKGALLLFLHADTELPDGWDWIIRKTLSDSSIVLGAFSFKIREPFRGRRWIEAATNYRSKVWKKPYGDQGLFMRAADFDQAGGFPLQPIMEDYALVQTFRKQGLVVTVPEEAITSGRRWLQHGVLKVTLINQLMILGYTLGISPERLAQCYRGRRSCREK